MPEIRIGERPVGDGHAPFIIAEAGINHNGETEKALRMIRVARQAGADAIKYQTFRADQFIGDPCQTFTYRSQDKEVTEPALAMFRRCELPREAWRAIKDECVRQGIVFLSTPQNRTDLDLLLEVGVPAVKVGSDDFTNLPLLKSYAMTGLPLILSCGMADMAEVRRSLEAVGTVAGYPTVLLLCTSQYPTPPQDVNLRKLATLREAFPYLVLGFSDHTQGPLAASVAAGFGATVFEKHFTLSHDLPGPDHWFSEDPTGLAAWVQVIRTAHVMLGSAAVEPTAAERESRLMGRRSIVAIAPIAKGCAFTSENIGIRRPGTGLRPEMYEQILGRIARRDFRLGEPLQSKDFEN